MLQPLYLKRKICVAPSQFFLTGRADEILTPSASLHQSLKSPSSYSMLHC